jgi:hypothetical protein
MLVIAKGYRSRPYVRTVVKDEEETVIVANSECTETVRSELAEGVGFPRNCVFEFDSALSDSLETAWDTGDEMRLAALWSTAEPYAGMRQGAKLCPRAKYQDKNAPS